MASLLMAVEEKFAQMADSHGLFVSGSPGVNDAGKLLLPPILCMDDRKISRAGDEERLRELFKDVEELDLMKNEISSWAELLFILRASPSLHALNLSQNPLGRAGDVPEWVSDERHRWPRMRTLALNASGVTWEQLLALLPIFPQLSVLHIGLNDLTIVPSPPPDQQMPPLRQLFFNANRLEGFEHLLRFSRLFPELEQLVVINNGLAAIDCVVSNAVAESEDPFPRLSYLNLSENGLCQWSCIDELRQLPALVDLRLTNNPILELLPVKESRMHVIARLPDLVRLNGSPIGEEERIDAERAFIRYYMELEEKPKRYHELVKKYGRLDPLAKVDLKPQSVVNFVLRMDESASSEVHALNVDQCVGDFKKEVCGLLGHRPSQARLYYFDAEINDREELRYSRRMMHSYRPSDGDELILIPK